MTLPLSQARATARTTRYPRWGRVAKSESGTDPASSVRPTARRADTERGQSSDVRGWKSSVFRRPPRRGARRDPIRRRLPPGAILFCGRRRRGGRFRRFGGRRRLGGRFRRLHRRVGGPEMPVAGRALPELLRRPGILGAGVAQLHRGAAPLATNRDVGVVHGRHCSARSARVATSPRAEPGNAVTGWTVPAGGLQHTRGGRSREET